MLVKDIAVMARKAEVTRMIITDAKPMNRAKPRSPRVVRAISAMERPRSRRLMKRVEKSCTAPNSTPPMMIHSQTGR